MTEQTVPGLNISSHLKCAGVALLLAVSASAQTVPGQAAPPRTGYIAGQVVDATSGSAIPEAIVRVTRRAASSEIQRIPLTGRVMADGEGRFFFAELPAGEYFLEATKDGYAPGSYGQRRPWGQSLRLALAEGERQTSVTVRAWKYAVIAGTVVDEAGEPVVGVAVRALAKNTIAGRTQYGNGEVVAELVPSAITDDRGMFRLPQLSPGSYVVVVPSSQTSVPMAPVGALSSMRSELFFSSVTDAAAPGHPRAQQVGDTAMLSAGAVTIPPPPSEGGRMEIYRTTYYPAASTAAAATAVSVAAGEERSDITISVKPEPSLRVSGRLVAPGNAPPPLTTLRLIGESAAGVVTSDLSAGPGIVGFDTASGMSDASGRFTFLGVPPGEYVLRHGSRFLARAWEQGGTSYWISHPVTVGKEDVVDLVVELRPALRVEGRFELRSGGRAVPMTPVMANALVVFETPFGEPGRFVAGGQGGTFATVAAAGQYFVRPYDRLSWFVESITVADKDITDKIVDLRSDMTGIVVIYTDKPSVVTGTVTAAGAAITDVIVLAFPTDTRLWRGYGASPRNLKSALVTATGAYTFDHLPPGEYHVVAVDAAEADDWQDPRTLAALAKQAVTLTVVAGASPRPLDLRVKTIR